MPLGILNTKESVPGTVLLRDDEVPDGATGLKHGTGKVQSH